jgi:hypothetical protein
VKLLLSLAFLLISGCSARQQAPDDITIRVTNPTSQTVYGFIGAGIFSQPITLEPGEKREYSVPRAWIPGVVQFTILEKKK